jgi:hypothetical protein
MDTDKFENDISVIQFEKDSKRFALNASKLFFSLVRDIKKNWFDLKGNRCKVTKFTVSITNGKVTQTQTFFKLSSEIHINSILADRAQNYIGCI